MTELERGPAPRPRRRIGLGSGLALSLATLLALLAAAEVALRLFSDRDVLDPLAAVLRLSRLEAHPYLAYANVPSYRHEPTPEDPRLVTHNSLGFRGPETTWEKPEGIWRIVCLGGSSTYGKTESRDEATWPARLEHHLNEAHGRRRVEVINGGALGYSTFESLINLELRMVGFRPDLVVVYHSINDVRCALYPGVRRDNTHWRAVWPVERKEPLERVLERSYAYLAWRFYLTDWWEERKNLGAYVVVDFGRYEDDYAQPDGAELGFQNFQRNLVSIVQVARGHGAEVLFVTQAMDYHDIRGAASREVQTAGMQRATDILFAVAAERGVPLVDGRKVLEETAARERAEKGEDTIFTHEVHLQDGGADLLARTIAAKILGEILPPE